MPLLKRKAGATVKELVKAASVSERSVYRWLKSEPKVVRLGTGHPVHYKVFR
jgi:predicted DNA-binding transcriptional regulator YafY